VVWQTAATELSNAVALSTGVIAIVGLMFVSKT
jgi:hypothetical protein